ncbi:MAG: AEC family transporter, partial [Pseudomonadota bacterium]
MATVLAVLADPILPVFAIMALGYAMGLLGVTSQEDARRINRFAMMIFLPMLIFGLLAEAPVERFALVPVLAYALVQVVITGTTMFSDMGFRGAIVQDKRGD